jgi:hypothetical protein
VQTAVLRAGVAESVAIKSGGRFRAAALERFTENVGGHRAR